jgi:hypothetical protein
LKSRAALRRPMRSCSSWLGLLIRRAIIAVS